MTDEDAFHAALDANPADSTLRLIFADWLEDRDDPRAAGYRAMGERCRIPKMTRYGMPVRNTIPGMSDPDWSFCCGGYETLRFPEDLPRAWSDALGSSHVHSTRREAEDAAALAFSRLSPGQQAAILQTAEVRT